MVVDLHGANHTGQELELMLQGRKPLAWFGFVEDSDAELIAECERKFEDHVKTGRLVKCGYSEELACDPRLGRKLKGKTLLYALPNEAWRISAMRLALKVNGTLSRQNGPGPDEAIDRMIGALLGYSDEEMDAYIAAGKYR
jgi:hypothetical protein